MLGSVLMTDWAYLDVERAVVPHKSLIAVTLVGAAREETVAPPGGGPAVSRAERQRAVRAAPARRAVTPPPSALAGAGPVGGAVVRTGGAEVAGTESLHHVVGVGVQQDQHRARAGRQQGGARLRQRPSVGGRDDQVPYPA